MNNDIEMIKEILLSTKTIATVGLSKNREKVSNSVAAYLQGQGYRVIPVNPTTDEILGEKTYADLGSIPEKIDVVQIFRRPEDVPPVVADAIKVGAKVVWMQEEGALGILVGIPAREPSAHCVLSAKQQAAGFRRGA